MKLNLSTLLLICSLALIACDSSDDNDTPTEPEAGTSAGESAAGEATPEAGAEAGDDSTPEAGAEAGAEAGTETEPEAGTEAGTETEAGSPAGTMMANVCNEVIEVGASCDLANDCCARGSLCAPIDDEGTEGQCFRACEIEEEAGPIGCESRELCVAVDEPGPDGITPGLCLRGDDCEPGNENLACGEGSFICNRRQNISSCFNLDEAEAEGFAIVGEGESCLSSEENPAICDSGLVCESNGTGGVCRRACGADTDCADGDTCLDYSESVDGVNFQFCAPVCDLASPDCGEGRACVLTDILNDLAYGTCRDVAPEEIANSGEACNVFDDEQPLKFCTAGNSCEYNGVNYVCVAVCSEMTPCADGETCVAATERYDNDAFQYNYCSVPCDPLEQNCEGDLACAFSGVVNGAPGGTCVAEPAPGTAVNGEDCTRAIDDPSYWGTCTANNVCFLDDENSDDGTCGSFCSEDRPDLCTGEYQACVDSNIEGLKLCQGTCSLEDNAGCDEGSACVFSFNEGVGADGNPRALGFCQENANIGEVTTGEPCVIGTLQFGEDEPFDYWYLNNCEPNHICIDLMDPENNPNPACFQSCSVIAETGCEESGTCECPDGYVCEQFWRDIDHGVCFPTQ